MSTPDPGACDASASQELTSLKALVTNGCLPRLLEVSPSALSQAEKNILWAICRHFCPERFQPSGQKHDQPQSSLRSINPAEAGPSTPTPARNGSMPGRSESLPAPFRSTPDPSTPTPGPSNGGGSNAPFKSTVDPSTPTPATTEPTPDPSNGSASKDLADTASDHGSPTPPLSKKKGVSSGKRTLYRKRASNGKRRPHKRQKSTHEKEVETGGHQGQVEHEGIDGDDTVDENEGGGDDATAKRARGGGSEVEPDESGDAVFSRSELSNESEQEDGRDRRQFSSMGAIILLRNFEIPKSIAMHLNLNKVGDPKGVLNDIRELQTFIPRRQAFRGNGERLLACYHISIHVETRTDFGQLQWLYSCLGIYDFVIAVCGDVGERISAPLMSKLKEAHVEFYKMNIHGSDKQKQRCGMELKDLEVKIKELFSNGRKLDRLTKLQGEGVIIMLMNKLSRNFVTHQLRMKGHPFDLAMQTLEKLRCRATANACGATLLATNIRRDYKMEYDPDPVEELTARMQPRVEDVGDGEGEK